MHYVFNVLNSTGIASDLLDVLMSEAIKYCYKNTININDSSQACLSLKCRYLLMTVHSFPPLTGKICGMEAYYILMYMYNCWSESVCQGALSLNR